MPIDTELKHIDEKLNMLLKEKKSSFEKILSIISDAVIPILLVIIASQQVVNERNESRRSEAQAKNELQLMYLELFYDDISDTSRQAFAIDLLSAMDDSLAYKLMTSIVVPNESIPLRLKEKLPKELRDRSKLLSLNKYSIKIFYTDSTLDRAKVIQQDLKFKKSLTISPTRHIITKEMVKNYELNNIASKNIIRYDSNQEKELADFLKELIDDIDKHAFQLQPVRSASPLSISVFLK
jgi:hypothetical protein